MIGRCRFFLAVPSRTKAFRANRRETLAISVTAAVLLAGGFASQVHAVDIVPTFDSSFSHASNPVAAEAAVQTAVATVNALFAGPTNNTAAIPVLFVYDASLAGGAGSNTVYSSVTYSTWRSTLQSLSSTTPSNTTLATAVANLPASTTRTMSLTTAYLNQTANQALFNGFDASGAFHSEGGQAYAAVITVSEPGTLGNFYNSSNGLSSDAVSNAEHEINEILGGGGAGSTLSAGVGTTGSDYGSLDLFRYLAGSNPNGTGTLGARTWNSSSSVVAYFSINGGASAVTDQSGNPLGFNQDGIGDYGDFVTDAGIGHIQDAYGSANQSPVYNSSSPEATMMQAIGYNLAVVPEPATGALFAAGIASLAFRRRRSSRRDFRP